MSNIYSACSQGTDNMEKSLLGESLKAAYMLLVSLQEQSELPLIIGPQISHVEKSMHINERYTSPSRIILTWYMNYGMSTGE